VRAVFGLCGVPVDCSACNGNIDGNVVALIAGVLAIIALVVAAGCVLAFRRKRAAASATPPKSETSTSAGVQGTGTSTSQYGAAPRFAVSTSDTLHVLDMDNREFVSARGVYERVPPQYDIAPDTVRASADQYARAPPPQSSGDTGTIVLPHQNGE